MQSYTWILLIAFGAFILYRRFAFALNKNVKNVTSEEAYKLIKTNKNMVVFDVRTRQEFKSGHIPGAKSVPVGEFASRIGEFERYKDAPVLVHCASGGRSPAAVRVLLKNNFNSVYHMNHGLTGWKYGLK